MFTEVELAYLAQARVGRLATVQRSGWVQNNPVGFYYNAYLQTIDIGGANMAFSQKFRNIQANPMVSLVADDMPAGGPVRVRCLEIRGTAEALLAPEHSAFHHPGPIIRIHPVRVISFGVDPGNPASGKRNVVPVREEG